MFSNRVRGKVMHRWAFEEICKGRLLQMGQSGSVLEVFPKRT